MTSRREFLANLSTGAAGLLAMGAAAVAVAGEGEHAHSGAARPIDGGVLHGPSQFPEATIQTSDGKTARLYTDLIKGKVVIINYMAIDNEKNLPMTQKILGISQQLGAKVGTDLHIISITSDPLRDTPSRLRAFAKRMGVPKHGWQFVSMSQKDSTIVATRLHGHHHHPNPNARIDVVHYGNDAVGLWGAFPLAILAEDAVMRVSSVLPGQPIEGPARRAGPRPLKGDGMAFNHRIA